MSYEREFDQLMSSTVSWEPYLTHNGYGQPSFGPAVSVKCRVEYDVRMARNSAGEEVTSTCQFYTSGVPGIGVKDRITLSDGTNAVTIVSVKQVNDESGPHHQEVYLS